MKRILLLLIAFAFNNLNLNAQCTPDPLLTEPGVYPDSATGFSNACVGVAYEQLITVIVPLDTTIMVGPVPVTLNYDSVVVVSFAGLPNGFSYICYDGQNTISPLDQCAFEGNTKGCVLITGNPTVTEIGSYNLTITVNAYLGGSTSPTATEIIDYYSIDVSNCVAGNIKLSEEKFIVYPNPAKDFIFIKQNSKDNIHTIKLYNTTGNIIREENGDSLSGIEIKSMESGIYFMEITTELYSSIVEVVVE